MLSMKNIVIKVKYAEPDASFTQKQKTSTPFLD